MKENILVFEVTEDTFLNEELKKHISRRYYRYIKHTGVDIVVNGKVRKGYEKVFKGDVIRIAISEQEKERDWPKVDRMPVVVFENENYLIVNKAKSLLTIPTKACPNSLYQELVNYLNTTNIHILNRLDRETNGLVVVAKNRYAASLLQPTHQHIIRKYICLVEGDLKEDGKIESYIEKESSTNKRYVTDGSFGKLAISHYWVLRRDGNRTLLEFILETGRTHQIRVHTSSIGHPIVGDSLYGSKEIGDLCLTSVFVGFIDPFTQEKIEFAIGVDF